MSELELRPVLTWLGNIVIVLGLLATVFGLWGVYRFRNFQVRLIAAAKVDTIGLIAVLVGVALRAGVSWFAAKTLLIIVVVLIANPIVTSQISARALPDQADEIA